MKRTELLNLSAYMFSFHCSVSESSDILKSALSFDFPKNAKFVAHDKHIHHFKKKNLNFSYRLNVLIHVCHLHVEHIVNSKAVQTF